jgi:hypothetical protein
MFAHFAVNLVTLDWYHAIMFFDAATEASIHMVLSVGYAAIYCVEALMQLAIRIVATVVKPLLGLFSKESNTPPRESSPPFISRFQLRELIPEL